MANFTDAKQQLKQMNVDKNLLRYLITDAKYNMTSRIYSIYVKPGMEYDISNIDFVQEIYAQNGINLKRRKQGETEILFIAASDGEKLTGTQREFLSCTAPFFLPEKLQNRVTEIVNTVEDRQYMAELQKQKDR